MAIVSTSSGASDAVGVSVAVRVDDPPADIDDRIRALRDPDRP